jgi:hypothetical protein
MDMEMQHGHYPQHGFGNAAWIWTMDMHGCRNADQKVCPAPLVFRKFTTLSQALAFRRRGQSGTASHGLVRLCPAMQNGMRVEFGTPLPS